MGSDTVVTFREGLERHDATLHRATPDTAGRLIGDLLDPPAVGVPLTGVELPDSVKVGPTPAELEAARTGITSAELGIAEYGSVMLEADPVGTEEVSLFVDRHIAVLRRRDLHPGLAEALETLAPRLRQGRSAVIATGPSATADMGELVLGAHGPRDVDVVLLDPETTDGDPGRSGSRREGE